MFLISLLSHSSRAMALVLISASSHVEVVDAAVAKAYGGQKIHWMEVFAGEIWVVVHGSIDYIEWCPSKTRSRSVVSAAERRTTPDSTSFVCVPSNILTAYLRRSKVPARKPIWSSSIDRRDIYAGIEFEVGQR
jgi:isocitrate dehydrogenase